MTPEQRASQPQHTSPLTLALRAHVMQLDHLSLQVLAMRVERASQEYPVDHDGRGKMPAFVKEWERARGPAPASATAVLDKTGTEKEYT